VHTLPAAISQEIMTIHHSKHHNTYVTNLNAGLEKLDAAMTANDVSAIIGLQGALKFNGECVYVILEIKLGEFLFCHPRVIADVHRR
jgi:superoxide dismutase